MSSETWAILAIIVASLFWSTAGIVGKALLRTFDPFTLAFLRSIFASLCIIPFLFKQKIASPKKIFTDIVPVALLSAGNIVFYYIGLGKTTVNASAVIYAATPLIVTIIATATIHEHITKMKLAGIFVGFLGVVSFLLLPALGRGEAVFGTLTGNLILLVAVVCWASYTVASRPLTTTKQYSPILVTAVSTFTSIPIFFVLTLFMPHTSYMRAFTHFETIALLLYVGFFITVVTYVLFQWAIKHSSSTTASLTNYLQPVFAFYFANLFLGEKITRNFLFGSILVLVGVFLVSGARIMLEIKKLLHTIRSH